MIIIRFPRWGRVQMTQAERTCTTKYIPGTYLLRVADGYMFLRICILFQEDTEVLKKLFLMVWFVRVLSKLVQNYETQDARHRNEFCRKIIRSSFDFCSYEIHLQHEILRKREPDRHENSLKTETLKTKLINHDEQNNSQ